MPTPWKTLHFIMNGVLALSSVLVLVTSSVIEGKLLLDGKAYSTMLIHLPDVPEPEMRLSVNKRQSLWPNGLIPYVINDDIEPANRDIIISAMDQFEDKTCIRFIPRTTETTYTRFVTKRGCTSLLGYSWSPQEISLRSPMCMHVGIVMHELMHTLGFLHEQCRPDRDDYVTILWNNIEQDYWRQFKKRTTDESITLGLPYDYCSIMHYDDHAFTSNGKKTLVPLKKPSCELGQKIRLSPLDIKKVNILYNCPGYRTNVGPIITSTSKPTTTLYENEGRLNKDHKYCAFWAINGECQKDPRFMLPMCPVTCGHVNVCRDRSSSCEGPVDFGACQTMRNVMLHFCYKSCHCDKDSKPATCDNQSEDCGTLATNENCQHEGNYGEYVKLKCPKSCGLC